MKVLVTAFLPFNNLSNNYSMEVIKYVESDNKEILDVAYDKCYEVLDSKYDLNSFDLIIALGEARMRNELTLEMQAVNISSCSLKDYLGVLKQNDVIVNNAPSVIKTKVNIDKLTNLIKFSSDAGKFVCNNLYYHLLLSHQSKSLFIHIPNCNDDTKKYEEYGNVINKIIKEFK